MSRHRMRARRLRFAAKRQQREWWARLLREGGTLACSPDALTKLDAGFVAALKGAGVGVHESPYLPPRTCYGFLKQPTLIETWKPEVYWTDFDHYTPPALSPYRIASFSIDRGRPSPDTAARPND